MSSTRSTATPSDSRKGEYQQRYTTSHGTPGSGHATGLVNKHCNISTRLLEHALYLTVHSTQELYVRHAGRIFVFYKAVVEQCLSWITPSEQRDGHESPTVLPDCIQYCMESLTKGVI